MQHKLLKKRILSSILPKEDRRKLILITGARQTGKTTLAQMQYPGLRYLNLDAPEYREKIREIPTNSWAQTIGPAILDEAQKEPILFEKIKYAYDAHAIDFSVLLGSSQILLLKKIRESLVGRISIFELFPLMLSEMISDGPLKPMLQDICGAASLDSYLSRVPAVLFGEEETRCLEAFRHLLQWGGMPELLYLTDEERRKWIKDYEYAYLERDLSDLARLHDLEPFRMFQKIAALRSGKLLNYSELARDAGTSVDTARRYLDYLNISYQVVLLQPYFQNHTKSLVKTPKLYWIDVGILRQLSGFHGDINGEIFETLVVSEIFKWIRTTQQEIEMFFYRTHGGLEVDLLLKSSRGILGIEIKTSSKLIKKDWQPLISLAQSIGKSWQGGIVIYTGKTIQQIGEHGIWAIPAWRLLNA